MPFEIQVAGFSEKNTVLVIEEEIDVLLLTCIHNNIPIKIGTWNALRIYVWNSFARDIATQFTKS